jgi:MFS family permease
MVFATGTHPRFALAALACLQTALLGAIVLGWASIANTLVVAPKEDGGAGLSLQESARLFSTASSSTLLSCLILGFVLDTFGPRTSSVVGNLLIAAGCQIISFSDTSFQYTLGMCFIAVGGPGVASSIFHVTNLFPTRKFFLISLFNGTSNISFCVLTLFGWLWGQFGVSINTSFRWFTLVALVSTIASWLSWPDEPFEDIEGEEDTQTQQDDTIPLLHKFHPTPEQDFVEATTKHLHLSVEQPLDSFLRALPMRNLDRSQSYHYSRLALAKGRRELVSLKDQPFWYQVRSGTYLRSLLVVVVTIFCANFYVASIAIELADENYFSSEQQHQLSSYLTIAMSWFGLFGSIFVGWLMDRIGLEWCTVTTLVLGQLHMLLLLLWGDSYWVMLVGFGIYTMFRQFLFPAFLATITARLGYKYFGILVGLAFTTCGGVQLIMPPLVHLVQGQCHRLNENDDKFICSSGNWKQLHMAQLGLLGLLLFSPLFDFQEVQKQKQLIKVVLDTPSSRKLMYGSAEGV